MEPLYWDQAHRDDGEKLDIRRICAEAWLKREAQKRSEMLKRYAEVPFLFSSRRSAHG
jgi:hypothetical protein